MFKTTTISSSPSSEKELEIDLECALCKDIYREPKTLGCLHSFCLKCLEIFVERNHSNICLTCPICRTPFQNQQKQRLSKLQTDPYLLNALYVHNSLKNSKPQNDNQKFFCVDEENEATSYCLDCEEHFCEACMKGHRGGKLTKSHHLITIEEMKSQAQIKLIIKSNNQIHCQTHQQEEMKLFCDDCELTICSLCVAQHPSHKILTISDVIGNEKQYLMNSINQVRPREKELREEINKCEEMIQQLEFNSATTQTQINQLFNKIRKKLDEKEQELFNQLVEIEKYKRKGLELQKEELEFAIESLLGSCQMIEHSLSLSTQNDSKLLAMKNLYHSRLNYLSTNIWKFELDYNLSIDFLNFVKEEQSIYSSISNIGVVDSNEISAEKCLIPRNEKKRIVRDEEFSFEIISYSKEENEMRIGGYEKKFIIKIQRELNDGINENNENNENFENFENFVWKIEDLRNGRYELKMKLKDEGKYLIFVQYDGININSSPFQIQIYPKPRNYSEINQPKLTFGSQGIGNGQFSHPYGITTDSKGNILVSDFSNHRIQIFNTEGKFISTFGNGNNKFNYPIGITMNPKGNIIVCDNHKVQVFDPEGKFISTFGSYGNGYGQFYNPSGITINSNGNIYICDNSNNRIQIFDAQGKFISTFGSTGSGNGQFSGPRGIETNSKGNVIVSDCSNRIQIFDSEGNFISVFGSNGNRNGQFNYPEGICVDANDNILVCDSRNHRIQIFNSEGKYISQFKANSPIDILIDHKTQNFIICGDDHKVSIY